MLLLFSAFATVFLLVFQQQNVTHRKYGLAAVTSALITVSQFIVIKGVSSGDLIDLGFMVVGGVLGVLASMKSHEWMITWFEKKRSARMEAYAPGGVDG